MASCFKTLLDFLLWGYVKDIVYKTSVSSHSELKLRIVAALGTCTPQTLENTWKETEYLLDFLRAKKVALAEAVLHSAVFIL
jgi:hypothetical protein